MPERRAPAKRRTAAKAKKPKATRRRKTADAKPRTMYLVLWWHLQRMYVGVFRHETEATLHAAARNGVVVELIGSKITVGSIEDYWRRDDEGRPMPGEWRTSRVPTPA